MCDPIDTATLTVERRNVPANAGVPSYSSAQFSTDSAT